MVGPYNRRMLRLSRPVVLASGSPRRHVLLAELIEEFEIVVPDIDETAFTVEDPIQTACELAFRKASAVGVGVGRPESYIIGADTVVAFNSPIGWNQLAKPADEAEAVQMLSALSGRTHIVVTGVAILTPYKSSSMHEVTEVTFRELSRAEIEAYVATGEPMDKAGGYGIQGGAADFVTSIDGSLSNVIGLPIERLEEMLQFLDNEN